MDIEEHKRRFEAIADKYDLKNEEKAGEIADFLVTHPAGVVSAHEFAKLFAMTKEEAETFLTFIDKGLRFKEAHIDRKPGG